MKRNIKVEGRKESHPPKSHPLPKVHPASIDDKKNLVIYIYEKVN